MSEKKRPSGYYAKVLGTFWRHPRTCGLSMAARGLWVSLLSWSADNLSDGAMPDAALLLVASGAPLKKERAELETSGLLVRNEARTGWVLRDWAQHNITRDKYERDKERARNGMANTRAREPSVTRNNTPRDVQPSDQDQDQDQDHRAESARGARAPVREAPAMAEARAHLDAFEARCEAVRAAVDRECRAVRRSPPPPACNAMSPEVTGIARWLATAGEVDIDAMVRRWAHARDRKGGWAPLRWLSNDPTEYAFPAPSDSVVRLTSEQEDASIEDFISAGTRRAEAL